MAAATFERLYRKALEDGIKAELARPKAERDAEVQAYFERQAENERRWAEQRARQKAEWIAAHPGETHWSDLERQDESEDAQPNGAEAAGPRLFI